LQLQLFIHLFGRILAFSLLIPTISLFSPVVPLQKRLDAPWTMDMEYSWFSEREAFFDEAFEC
jgi:hypothetical protein